MTNNELKAKAQAIAILAHTGQYDKAGKPYIEHVERVASMVDDTDTYALLVAYLHDVLEDSDITAEDLAKWGMPALVIEAVLVMTKKPGQNYDEYLALICGNGLAHQVKLYDLIDNATIDRIPEPTPEDYRRTAKYMNAIAFLMEAD